MVNKKKGNPTLQEKILFHKTNPASRDSMLNMKHGWGKLISDALDYFILVDAGSGEDRMMLLDPFEESVILHA